MQGNVVQVVFPCSVEEGLMSMDIGNKIKRIEQLKAACDSISANAVDFIGKEEYPVRWEIDIVFEPHAAPVIELKRQSIPAVVLEKGLL